MVVSNAHEKFGFLHISFYKIVQIVLPIIEDLAVLSQYRQISALSQQIFVVRVVQMWH